ncbi:MAG TPA: Hsp33 family molecular chaperone HslO [Clostridiales bacterium]|nr:Hsp33 family molecular chaperone HslO [Clostridiales bacterium]
MGRLLRLITKDGAVMATVVDSTDIVNRAEQIHNTSAVVTAALGRLLTAASMMGNMLKGENESITLRLAGNGPAGQIVAVSDSSGNVRGYASNSVVEIPLNEKGKLDVAGAVGRQGYLYVIKDLGLNEPYNGSIPLVSGEIAEDITAYYAISEQIPTVCALGVLVNPDLSIKAAGGFIVQLLPSADENTISIIEKNISVIPAFTEMLSQGLTLEDIIKRVLADFEIEVLAEKSVQYKCNCSQERVERALISLGKEELSKIARDKERIEVKCHFCDNKYYFNPEQISEFISKSLH